MLGCLLRGGGSPGEGNTIIGGRWTFLWEIPLCQGTGERPHMSLFLGGGAPVRGVVADPKRGQYHWMITGDPIRCGVKKALNG